MVKALSVDSHNRKPMTGRTREIWSLLADYAHMALRLTPVEWAAFLCRRIRWRFFASGDVHKAQTLERRLADPATSGNLVSILAGALGRKGGYHFDRAERDLLTEVAKRVAPEYVKQIIAEAESICHGQGKFIPLHSEALGRGDWLFKFVEDPETALILDRFRYMKSLGFAYVYTGEERYVEVIVAFLESWLRRAHPENLFFWNPLSIAVRVDSWLWALALTEGSRSLSPELRCRSIASILAQVWFLERHIETEPATNHGIFEVKTLLLCGALLRENPLGLKWLQRGRILFHQFVRKQFLPDGVHWEQSTYYHLLVANEMIESLAILDRLGWEESEARHRLVKMAAYIRDLLLPDGRIPLVGDSFDPPGPDAPVEIVSYPLPGDILLGASALLRDSSIAKGMASQGTVSDRMIWLLGEEVARNLSNSDKTGEAHSVAYPDGGVYIMRSSDGLRALLVDCGPLGARPNPGHGHADALSILLADSGGMILTDPGAFTYTAGRWRSYFRSTAAHNTVLVDGVDQAPQRRAFRFGRLYKTNCRQFITGKRFDFFEGEHNGYHRLPGQVTHRRQVLFIGKRHVLLNDVTEGEGSHSVEVLFHFDPRWDCRPLETGVWEFQDGASHGLLICWVSGKLKPSASLEKGLVNPVAGWVSKQYGQKNPAYRAKFCISGYLPLVVSSLLLLQPEKVDLDSLRLESRLLPETSETRGTGFITEASCELWKMIFMNNPTGQDSGDNQFHFQGRLGFYAENVTSGGRAGFFKDIGLFSMEQTQLRPPPESKELWEFWEGDPWKTGVDDHPVNCVGSRSARVQA